MSKPWCLIERSATFGIDVCRFCRQLPRSDEAREAAGQLRRAARGVGAGYRAARRARSSLEFIAKLGGAIEEADEAMHWLEHLTGVGIGDTNEIEPLRQEASELVAILTQAQKTAKTNFEKDQENRRKKRRKKPDTS
jgi:four helix bundle protein